MSLDSIRSHIISTVRATTPPNKNGNNKFTELKDGDIEQAGIDRAFTLSITDPPTQIGKNLNLVTWRFQTSFEIAIKYGPRSRAVMDSCTSGDAMELQKNLQTPSNLGSSFGSYAPQGDGHINVEQMDDDNSGERLLVLGLTITHA